MKTIMMMISLEKKKKTTTSSIEKTRATKCKKLMGVKLEKESFIRNGNSMDSLLPVHCVWITL